MAGKQGIEIPITLNADGSVTGLERLTQGLEAIRKAAAGAGTELDKVGAKGGAGGGPSTVEKGGGAAGSSSWWDSRMGQLSEKVISAGLTFVERSLPAAFDPFKSATEKGLEAAPTAARLSTQLAAGAALSNPEIMGTTINLPEAMKQQIIQTLGVAAEEAAKALVRFTKMEMQAARMGAEGTLGDFARVGMMPDQDTIQKVLTAHQLQERRMIALRLGIAEAQNAQGMSVFDPQTQKQLSTSDKDVASAALKMATDAVGASGGGR